MYLDHFNDATAETDPGLCFLRYWQILEGIAEIRKHSDNSALTDFQGKPIPGRHGGAKARVYKLLKEWKQIRKVLEAPWSDAPENVGLWQYVVWWHAMRSCIAHHGRFAFKDNILQTRFSDYPLCEAIFLRQGGLDGFILDALKEETEFVVGNELWGSSLPSRML